ncbi:MAG: VWA domain-containing protein [Planctomycetaceae bacterium]|nr:VWA domain-containing protein [Planctomycetaceae bacterium]
MRNVKIIVCAVSLAVLWGLVNHADESKSADNPKVQIALLLDTSNSMDGLINQAKSQLWEIVNDFATAKQNGKTPDLEVALYHYGNSSLSKESNYIEQLTPFTDNLDLVSEKLFALKTNGGLEYCGAVIQRAVQDLKWSERPDDLRLIFIAGNEPFTQGPLSYADACKEAVEMYIVINTIHCGDEQTGIATKWKDGALLTDGKYLVINQNEAVVSITAPQDKRLAELNSALNATYIPYGRLGLAEQANQAAQDSNSAGTRMLAARVATKASGFYRNSGWDLVDASKEQEFDLAKIEKSELPENMQKMTLAEQKSYIAQQSEQRKKIQEEIAGLSKERDAFITAEMKKQSLGKEQSLGNVMRSSIRAQAAAKSFQYSK